MSLVTKSEVKELLQIAETDTSKDALIESLITKTTDFIVRRINSFFMPEVYAFGSNISFSAVDNSINDADGLLDIDGFAVDNDIVVLGSYQNNRIFTIASLTASKIMVNEAIKEEASNNQVIYIHRIDFTEDIKLAAADFIAGKLRKTRDAKSESLGDYSITYLDNKEMMTVFSQFKKVQWF